MDEQMILLGLLFKMEVRLAAEVAREQRRKDAREGDWADAYKPGSDAEYHRLSSILDSKTKTLEDVRRLRDTLERLSRQGFQV